MVGERRASDVTKYHLFSLLATGPNALAPAIKACWNYEQGHQQLKEELGLGHFQGRSWTGLHRHALMTMLALAFLRHHRLTEALETTLGVIDSSWMSLTPCSSGSW